MDLFYQYWSPVPKPPPLRTEAKLCFDDRGLYLAVTMYEERLDRVRAEVRGRDNPETWMDDCVEIMLDPGNTGSSYYKFTTNLNGARHDQRSANLTLDDGWSPEGWAVATGKGTDAWYIEFALPWEDIGIQAREGDVWSFDLVRYGYSSGSFKGVTWSLGGAGAQPAKLGYLGFGAFDMRRVTDLERIAQAAEETKGPGMYILTPEFVVTRKGPGAWTRRGLAAWAREPLGEAMMALWDLWDGLEKLPDGTQPGPLSEKSDGLVAAAAGLDVRAPRRGKLTALEAALVRQEATLVRREALELKWRVMLEALVAGG